MIRELDDLDIKMFFYLQHVKELSECIDKQVACVIVDSMGEILSTGVNTIIECDKNCHDKEHRICDVDHAEVVAVRNLNKENLANHHGIRAYVSLFPCANCQRAILPYVSEIVTFGMIHKDWVSDDKLTVFHHLDYTLIKHNGENNQRTIVAGELAELITEISDYFCRENDKSHNVWHMADEISDVELQLDILKILVHAKDREIFNALRITRAEKACSLLCTFGENRNKSYNS